MTGESRSGVSVAIIVDHNFPASELIPLCQRMHVWMVQSEQNSKSAEQWLLRNVEAQGCAEGAGLTCFSPPMANSTPEASLAWILDEVDAHHNEYSTPPGWDHAVIFGARPSSEVVGALEEIGFATNSSFNDEWIIFSR